MSDDRHAVVFVPGIGFGGAELRPLARWLRKLGHDDVRIFPHQPGRIALDQSARKLAAFVAEIDAPTIHFVAHSLGGLVTLQFLADTPDARPGNVVLLAPPLTGSVAARRVRSTTAGRRLLGHAGALLAECERPQLPDNRRVGALAGRLNTGPGFLLAPRQANDSIVAVDETRHPDLADHITLTVSHGSMLLAPSVARAIDRFLRHGSFATTATHRVR